MRDLVNMIGKLSKLYANNRKDFYLWIYWLDYCSEIIPTLSSNVNTLITFIWWLVTESVPNQSTVIVVNIIKCHVLHFVFNVSSQLKRI